MKPFLTLLIATLCAATSYGQTMKALSYNASNGVVTYSGTNTLTFTNEVRFSSGDLRIDSAGAIYWSGDLRYEPETQTFHEQIQFDSPLTASNTRNNLGLPLPALTNTSNVTTMRALSGSTNTNHPFSGSVSVVGTNNTNTLVFSNGILQSVQ
jgi:hypothetical protein